MMSGATGLDAVLLCISATDSVMPQTKEHFEILKLLDLRHGIIVLTMCDLADEEDIELIEEKFQRWSKVLFWGAPPLSEHPALKIHSVSMN